jgi:hypothetical protein
MNSCMFTCVISHLIGLQVGCSGTVVERFVLCGMWRIPLLSCRWSFGLCRGCCISGTVPIYQRNNIYIYIYISDFNLNFVLSLTVNSNLTNYT